MHPVLPDAAGSTIVKNFEHSDQKIPGFGRVNDLINAKDSGGIPGFGVFIHFLKELIESFRVVLFFKVVNHINCRVVAHEADLGRGPCDDNA